MMEINIEKVTDPNELEKAESRMMDIHFDCLVRMFDSGQYAPRDIIPFQFRPPQSSQWFKSQMKLSLEFIRESEPHVIGMAIKRMLGRLDSAIKDYEKYGKVTDEK